MAIHLKSFLLIEFRILFKSPIMSTAEAVTAPQAALLVGDCKDKATGSTEAVEQTTTRFTAVQTPKVAPEPEAEEEEATPAAEEPPLAPNQVPEAIEEGEEAAELPVTETPKDHEKEEAAPTKVDEMIEKMKGAGIKNEEAAEDGAVKCEK
uniref:Uncharacterized protein n=1 Tax=Kalanchoe fedtschenkoi TaxID=63787 RepID=A0A7N0TTY5_KALFE